MKALLHEREVAMDGDSAAFDLWLQRELRHMYIEVLEEPVPDDLVALILA